MKTHNIILVLFSILIPLIAVGQVDTLNSYRYDINFNLTPMGKSKILNNKLLGLSDTNLALITGHVFNWNNEPLKSAVVHFSRQNETKKTAVFTDSLGFYENYIIPGKYVLTAIYMAFALNDAGPFYTDTLVFSSGQKRQIDFKLSESRKYYSYTIISKKQYSSQKIRKKEKQFMHREWKKLKNE